MGCWYETCGLSGAPIEPKTRCRLFLLATGNDTDTTRSGFSYPTGQWQPVAPPFSGEYNDDRGTIDLDEKPPPHWAYTKEFLDEDSLMWSDGHEGSEPKPIKAAYDYETFFFQVERGWVTGRSQSFGYKNRESGWHYPLGQMLVREDVWEFLLSVKIDESAWQKSTRDFNRKQAKDYVDYLVANPLTTEKKYRGFVDERFLRNQGEGVSPFYWTMFEHQEAGARGGMYRVHLTHDIDDKKINPALALEIFYEFADLSHVNRVMSHLRRAWRPQPGKGSQDVDWDLHKRFAQEIIRIAKREEKRYDE